jgi:hypothetical protein
MEGTSGITRRGKKRWEGVFAALAVMLLLVACEKELGEKKSGKDVLVRVRLVGVAEGGKDDVTRSGSMGEMEEVLTPVGDGMLLGMWMERDEEDLRAAETTLAGDVYFRVVAVVHGTSTFISYGDFTIDDGCVTGGLHVPDNDSYDFICYSYNSNTAFGSALTYKQGDNIAGTVTIDAVQGTKDLLYEKIEDVPVSGAGPELDILLRRVMARVKVMVDCSYNNWGISAIANTMTLGAVANTGTVNLVSGAMSGTTGTKAISWPTLSASTSQESTEMLVMPKNSSTLTVTVPKEAVARVSLGQIPSATATGTFSTALVAGNSYKLRVRLRTSIWARSNIYWQEVTDDQDPKYPGYLTFEPAADDPVNNDDTKQGYQGVFFVWGSLVGLPPNNDHTYPSWQNAPIYKPVVKDPLTTSTWTATTGNIQDIMLASYITITVGTPGRDNTTAIDAEQNNLATYQALAGDICQYLSTKTGVVSGDYRLPTSMEFGLAGSWELGGTYRELDISEVNAYGTTTIIGGSSPYDGIYAKSTTMGNVIFPASGWLHYTAGELVYAGAQGVYWSGSRAESSRGHDFCFDADVRVGYDDGVYYGESVRCVKK